MLSSVMKVVRGRYVCGPGALPSGRNWYFRTLFCVICLFLSFHPNIYTFSSQSNYQMSVKNETFEEKEKDEA